MLNLNGGMVFHPIKVETELKAVVTILSVSGHRLIMLGMLNSKSENPEYFGRTPLDEAKVSLKNNERRFMWPSLKTKQEIHDLIQSAINKMDEPPITTG